MVTQSGGFTVNPQQTVHRFKQGTDCPKQLLW